MNRCFIARDIFVTRHTAYASASLALYSKLHTNSMFQYGIEELDICKFPFWDSLCPNPMRLAPSFRSYRIGIALVLHNRSLPDDKKENRNFRSTASNASLSVDILSDSCISRPLESHRRCPRVGGLRRQQRSQQKYETFSPLTGQDLSC